VKKMRSLKRKNRAQTMLEYAVLIAVVAGAVIVMRDLIKRGLQGKWWQEANQLGQQFASGETETHRNANYTITKEKSDGTTSGSGSYSYSGQTGTSKGEPAGQEDFQ
jgi:Flp pilus assembly pilin Flp